MTEATIKFRHHSETPTMPEDDSFPTALLFNQCDGYHLVYARFYEDGEFYGFYDWCGTSPYEPGNHFCAWALLPPSGHLYEPFADKDPHDIKIIEG